MKPATLCLAAALAVGLAIPAATAQTTGNAFDDSPLTLEQEQALSEVRERDRRAYVKALKETFHGLKYKPISEWTQRDFREFSFYYDKNAVIRGEPDRELHLLMFRIIAFSTDYGGDSDGEGDGGDGGGDGGGGY